MGEILEKVVDFGVADLIGVSLACVVGIFIESSSPSIIPEDVIGNKTPDKFYYTDGKRVYLEIDGNSVEEYFRK